MACGIDYTRFLSMLNVKSFLKFNSFSTLRFYDCVNCDKMSLIKYTQLSLETKCFVIFSLLLVLKKSSPGEF